jgi:hypothetical protein
VWWKVGVYRYIPAVLDKFNSFDKNLQFTVDTFPDNVIHFWTFWFRRITLMFTTKVRTLDNTRIFLVLNHFHVKLRGLDLCFTEHQNYAAPVNYLKTKFESIKCLCLGTAFLVRSEIYWYPNSKTNFLRIDLALTFLTKTTLGLRFGYAFHTLVNKVKL